MNETEREGESADERRRKKTKEETEKGVKVREAD